MPKLQRDKHGRCRRTNNFRHACLIWNSPWCVFTCGCRRVSTSRCWAAEPQPGTFQRRLYCLSRGMDKTFLKNITLLTLSRWGKVNLDSTFLGWGDLDDVVSQTHVFAKAVTNIIDRTIWIFVGVRSHAIHRQVLRKIHLAKRPNLPLREILTERESSVKHFQPSLKSPVNQDPLWWWNWSLWRRRSLHQYYRCSPGSYQSPRYLWSKWRI